MKKSTPYDREIISISKNVEYMVQAVKGALSQENKESIFRCQNDREVFACLWSAPCSNDILTLEEEFDQKSATQARTFREKGNGYFKKQAYLTALQEYNNCVIQAPFRRNGKMTSQENSEELALAYGNRLEFICYIRTVFLKKMIDIFMVLIRKLLHDLCRSAALVQLGKYKESLLDIQRALQQGYPHASVHKLLHRQGICQLKLNIPGLAKQSFEESMKKLNEQDLDDKNKISWRKTLEKCLLEVTNKSSDGNRECELTTDISPEISVNDFGDNVAKEVSDLINVKKDSKNQNVVLSKNDVDVGEILIVEKPYASVLFPKRLKKQKCYNCFSSLPPNPMPCYDCTSVLFCNELCRDSSYQRFHKFECHYFALFGEDTCSDIGHLAIRLFMTLGVKRILSHLKNYDSVNTMNEIDNSKVNGDEGKQSDAQNNLLEQDEINHLSVLGLEACGFRKPTVYNNDELVPMIELPFFACFLVKLLHIAGYLDISTDLVAKYITPKNDGTKLEVIQEETNLVEADIQTDNDFFLIGGFLVNCLRIVRRFAKLIRESKNFGDDPEKCHSSVLGIGLYPKVVSKVNHSCDPSADIVHCNNMAVIRSMRKLRKDDEVTISFGPLFHEIKLEPRRKLLWKANSLLCNCVACQNKWPILEEMFDEVPSYICEECRCILTATDKEDGKFLVCSLCKHKQNLEEIVEKLRVSFDDYAMSMNEAMSGNHVQALSGLCGHLNLIQKHIRQPWPDLVACQTAVRLCYRLMANREEFYTFASCIARS